MLRNSLEKNRHDPCRRCCEPPLIGMLGVAVMISAVVAPVGASAQQRKYKQDPVSSDARTYRGEALRAVNDASFYANEKQKVGQFFVGYYFPMMTSAEPNDLGRLGKNRTDLFKQYIWPAENQAMQKDLTTLIFQFARKVIGDRQYHPAVRLNAVIILGQLDAEYAVESGANPRPPQPLPAASDLLCQIVVAGVRNQVPPALVAAALTGLERHAQFHQSLPPATVAKMEQTLVGMASLQKPFAEIGPDVHHWLRRRAISAAAELGSVGRGNGVLSGVVALSATEEMSLDDRCATAALLANLNLEGVTVDGLAVSKPIVQLAAAVGEDSRKLADEYIALRGRRREEDKLERRRLLARLENLEAALAAIQPLAGESAQPAVIDARTAIGLIRKAAADDDVIDLDLAIKVRQMADTLAAAADTLQTAPDAAATAESAAPADASAVN